MRITSGMMMDNLSGTLTESLSSLNASFERVSTEKKFTRASDDPTDAVKTLQSLHTLSSLTQYQDNIDETTSWVNNTESTVNIVNQIATSAQETLTAASNTATTGTTDASAYAQTLQSLQTELVQTLNTTFSGRYVFGGVQTGAAPFKVGTTADDGADNNGKLMYYDYNAATPSYVAFSSINTTSSSGMQLTLPVDVGLGMRMDASGKAVSSTVFEAQTSGISLLAANMTATGCSDLFDTLGSAITKLQAGGTVDLTDELSDVQDEQDSVLTTDVGLGEKSNMLTFLGDKNQTDTLNQQSRLSELQDVDVTKAITEYQMRQMVYQASLSVGAKILQSSLIDFLK
ncbi:MAG: flagellar hook-associated protein FlgL [Clostridia bacterium]|nr:flagellar hook-associated protein FlgL [Clostridia bacterium]